MSASSSPWGSWSFPPSTRLRESAAPHLVILRTSVTFLLFAADPVLCLVLRKFFRASIKVALDIAAGFYSIEVARVASGRKRSEESQRCLDAVYVSQRVLCRSVVTRRSSPTVAPRHPLNHSPPPRARVVRVTRSFTPPRPPTTRASWNDVVRQPAVSNTPVAACGRES